MKNNLLSERVLKILEWDSILKELDSRCATSRGKDMISGLKPQPRETITARVKMISELKGLISKEESPDFTGITDIGPFIQLVLKDGVLRIPELSQIRNMAVAVKGISKYINSHKEELTLVSEEFGELDETKELRELLSSSITESDELNDNKYKELKHIKEQLSLVKNDIEKKINSIIHSPSKSQAIQEKVYSIRNDRYVILVKSEMKSSIKGTMHDISSSGATLYIEPAEITGLNNRLVMLERDFTIEINKILRQLSKETAKYSDQLLHNLSLLADLDFLTAAARLSISIKGSEPVISGDNILNLYNARHPLLYLMNPGSVVPNDISIGKDYTCMIISGANTGGKTILLKTAGLCALLIMHGLHIPAGPDSEIGIFSNILADIGDDQNIVQSLSTYSGQVVIINDMIAKADEKTLVLVDELLVGTNPRQGAVLAQAVLEALVRTKAVILITTHYSELKDLPAISSKFINASVSFDVETLRPTYKLRTGLPGTSYTIEIAKNYGMREDIISRSKELLDEKELSTEALLENIQKHRQEIDEEYVKIEEIKKEISREKALLEEKENRLSIETEELKNSRGIEFIDEINRYRERISDKIKNIREDSIKDHENINQELLNLREKISGEIKKDSKKRFLDKYLNFKPGEAETGDTVFIVPLEKTGTIEQIDKENKTAVILLGSSIKSRYSFSELLVPAQKKKTGGPSSGLKKRDNAPEKPDVIGLTIQTKYNTSDLRGLIVDSALNKLENDLDRMMRSNINTAVVIHGHGTGALKTAVRQWLRFSHYVKGFRPGEQSEGGDGVSIVQLKD